jgi:hypothetical protein
VGRAGDSDGKHAGEKGLHSGRGWHEATCVAVIFPRLPLAQSIPAPILAPLQSQPRLVSPLFLARLVDLNRDSRLFSSHPDTNPVLSLLCSWHG